MNPILIFGIIASLFVFFILFNTIFSKFKVCAICAAVSATWLSLLGLYLLGKFEDKIIIAILAGQSIVGVYYLMEKAGQSVVGIYYFLEKKVSEKLLVFRLPFLLTLTAVIYLIFSGIKYVIGLTLLLIFIWMVMAFLFIYSSNPKLNALVNKIVECCKYA